jgi:hypothetical protein
MLIKIEREDNLTKDSFMLGRGREFCRGCNGIELFSALDLGLLPIANELWAKPDELVERFPLHLRICKNCGLGQVEDVVTPTRLFRDYRYLSSTTTSFIEHARLFVDRVLEELEFKKDEWVLEIASNDGYLLQHFIKNEVDVVGIEPAANVAKFAQKLGIPTISEFFSLELAQELVSKRGNPRLIIANNVMAHVPDIRNFLSGISTLAGPNTLISVENPSLMNFIEFDQFDTIYHEHFSYLTSHSVDSLTKKFGLELYDVEKISTHGGSLRYWIRKTKQQSEKFENVEKQIKEELDKGLFDVESWKLFHQRIQVLISDFHDWSKKAFDSGLVVYGYGAAAKASTLLNASGIDRQWISAIADASFEKQGRYMPAAGIPIIKPEEMISSGPTDIVIFPWNLSHELAKIIVDLSKSPVRVWQAVPRMQRVV